MPHAQTSPPPLTSIELVQEDALIAVSIKESGLLKAITSGPAITNIKNLLSGLLRERIPVTSTDVDIALLLHQPVAARCSLIVVLPMCWAVGGHASSALYFKVLVPQRRR